MVLDSPSAAVALQVGPTTTIAETTGATSAISTAAATTRVAPTGRAVASDVSFLTALVALGALISRVLAGAVPRDMAGAAAYR